MQRSRSASSSYDQLPPSPEAFGRPTYWTPYSKGELMLSNYGGGTNGTDKLYAPSDGYLLSTPGTYIWYERESAESPEGCGSSSLPTAVPPGVSWLPSQPYSSTCGKQYPWTDERTYVEQMFVPFVPRETVVGGPPGTTPSEGVDSEHDPGGTYSPPEGDAGTVLKDSWSDPDFSEATKWLDKTLAVDFPRYREKWEQHRTDFTPAYSDPDTYKEDAQRIVDDPVTERCNASSGRTIYWVPDPLDPSRGAVVIVRME